MSKSDKKQS